MRLSAAQSSLKTGVYMIRNRVNGKVYIGSAAGGFNKRWNLHRHLLREGKHDNRHLQSAWTQDGEAAFEFLVIARCSPEWCLVVEQIHIQANHALDPDCGYNIEAVVGHGMLGRKHSPESRAKMSASRKKYVFTPERRKKHSDALKRTFSTNPNIRNNIAEANRRPEKIEASRRGAIARWSKTS